MRSSFPLDAREFRYRQYEAVTSAADAVVIRGTVVPNRILRIVRFAALFSSAGEVARIYSFGIETLSGQYIGIQTNDVAVDYSEIFAYCLGQFGQELVLLPGENLRGDKSAAGVGETITLRYGFVEYSLPGLSGRTAKATPTQIPAPGSIPFDAPFVPPGGEEPPLPL